jgi:hypothetical protein
MYVWFFLKRTGLLEESSPFFLRIKESVSEKLAENHPEFNTKKTSFKGKVST